MEEGGLIYFVKTAENEEYQQRKKGFVGHPPEAAWFCGTHYAAAREYSNLTLPEAMLNLRAKFTIEP